MPETDNSITTGQRRRRKLRHRNRRSFLSSFTADGVSWFSTRNRRSRRYRVVRGIVLVLIVICCFAVSYYFLGPRLIVPE